MTRGKTPEISTTKANTRVPRSRWGFIICTAWDRACKGRMRSSTISGTVGRKSPPMMSPTATALVAAEASTRGWALDELEPNDDKGEASIAGLLLSGGKVDPVALRRAWEDSEGEDEGIRLSFCLQRDLQTRLDKYLTNRVGFMSRSRIQRLIDHGLARVNDRPARCATKLRKGDVVEVVIPPPPSKEILAEDIPIDVLYEDEYLLVLNKRPDIIVHPAKSEQSGTLLNAIAWHVEHGGGGGGALSTVGSAFKRPGVVHRLDLVAGVVLDDIAVQALVCGEKPLAFTHGLGVGIEHDQFGFQAAFLEIVGDHGDALVGSRRTANRPFRYTQRKHAALELIDGLLQVQVLRAGLEGDGNVMTAFP